MARRFAFFIAWLFLLPYFAFVIAWLFPGLLHCFAFFVA